MIFSKRQNCGDGEDISVCRGWSGQMGLSTMDMTELPVVMEIFYILMG